MRDPGNEVDSRHCLNSYNLQHCWVFESWACVTLRGHQVRKKTRRSFLQSFKRQKKTVARTPLNLPPNIIISEVIPHEMFTVFGISCYQDSTDSCKNTEKFILNLVSWLPIASINISDLTFVSPGEVGILERLK